jgi:hypothetical protein
MWFLLFLIIFLQKILQNILSLSFLWFFYYFYYIILLYSHLFCILCFFLFLAYLYSLPAFSPVSWLFRAGFFFLLECSVPVFFQFHFKIFLYILTK